MSNEENKNDSCTSLVRIAMEADEKIDALKAQIEEQMKIRHDALGSLIDQKVKRFEWKGTTLTIFKKGDAGSWSVKGKGVNNKNGVFIPKE